MGRRLTLLALLAFTTTARADDGLISTLETQISQAWYRDSETGAWLLADAATNGLAPAPCSVTLGKLRNSGAPASRTIELHDDSRDLRRGVHALPAARKACDAIEHAGKIKEVERWIVMAAESDSVKNRKAFARCIETFAAAAALDPATRVPERRIRIGRDTSSRSARRRRRRPSTAARRSTGDAPPRPGAARARGRGGRGGGTASRAPERGVPCHARPRRGRAR